jgi:hypothetical protein
LFYGAGELLAKAQKTLMKFNALLSKSENMSPFSSKELYIMNGGNKTYIYKDGFGDVYNATPAEEAEWAQEVIQRALAAIDSNVNPASFNGAIDSLLFHNYPNLEALLLKKMEDTSPVRQVLFATAMWRIYQYEKSLDILLYQVQHRSEYLTDIFLCLKDFKNNIVAKKFILACMEGDDDILFAKANITINMWAYSGIPALRENSLLEALRSENKNKESFRTAIKQLKKILGEN